MQLVILAHTHNCEESSPGTQKFGETPHEGPRSQSLALWVLAGRRQGTQREMKKKRGKQTFWVKQGIGV